MYLAAVALIGASVGQPPVPPPAPAAQVVQEPLFNRDRLIRLPIKYDRPRNTIRLVTLWFSRDNGNTWERGQALTPQSDKDLFQFMAPEDGQYWFTMVDEDLKGNKSVTDLTKTPPDLKVIVKTVKPRIVFTQAKRDGETIVIEWQVEDRYPNESLTRVHFKKVRAPETDWQEVTLPTTSKSGVKFPAGTLEPIVVRVIAYDMAKNFAVEMHAFEAGTRGLQAATTPPAGSGPAGPLPPAVPPTVMPVGSVITTSGSQVAPAAPVAAPNTSLVMPAAPVPPSLGSPLVPSGPPFVPPTQSLSPSSDPVPPVAPPTLSPAAPSVPLGLTSTPMPSATTTPAPYVPPSPPAFGSPAPKVGSSPGSLPASSPAAPTCGTNHVMDVKLGASMTPSSPVLAPVPPGSSISGSLGSASSSTTGSGTTVLSTQTLPVFDPHQPPTVSGGTLPVWTGPQFQGAIETPHVPVINYLSFDLGYEVETHGPSGISRVDLWVTRDDGRTWMKWSQHDGKGSTVRVNLNIPANPQPEGTYGFRVVPVSGAGLSEREPVAGDAPDLRVVVDVTPPQLDLYPPIGDPTNPDNLLLQWKASDKNWGDDPITIEWCDKPTGPWQPVAAGGELVQTVGGTTPTLRHLPNTGQYAWRVPSGLPPRVYLKVCARDSAGNVREVITRDPILIDLVKPRAKINGIVPPHAPTVVGAASRP